MDPVRLALVGDYSAARDEGYKNVTHALAAALERRTDLRLTRVDGKHLLRRSALTTYFRSHVALLHFIAQPSLMSLLAGHLAAVLPPRPRIIISGLRSEPVQARMASSTPWRWVTSALRPDLLLVQDDQAKSCFAQLGIQTAIVPNGVDLIRFRPAGIGERIRIRQELGLDADRPVVVHVGHLEAARRLDWLLPLIDRGIQVLIVGSTYLPVDRRLVEGLREAGAKVVVGYMADVERVYRAADCYAFPVEPTRSLSTPLSVLEALASGIPVVSTRFRGLEYLVGRNRAITFVENAEAVPAAVEAARRVSSSECRALVNDLAWEKIADEVVSHYRRLLAP